MKNFKLVSLCLILVAALAVPAYAGVEFSQDLFVDLAQNTNAIPHIEIPEYDRLVLDNGLVVYLVEDDHLPIIEVHGFIQGGRSQESLEKPGLSDLMVLMMNSGTESLGEHEFSRFKEMHSLDLDFSVADDTFMINGSALCIDQGHLIGLIADILQNPNFTADYFARNLQEFYQLLSYALYRDDLLVDIFFESSLFEGHPYGNGSNVLAMLQVLPYVTPGDLQDLYNKTIDPANMVLVIVGDIDKTQTYALLQTEFGSWPSPGLELAKPQVVADEGIYNMILLVNKPDATQAKMKMGYNFYNADFDQKIAFLMGNQIFGSGTFSSRLMTSLRTQKGYVYGIQSTVTYSDLGGLYYISTDVAPDKVCETREIIIREMAEIQMGTAAISPAELSANVNLYNALLPLDYKDKMAIMKYLVYTTETQGQGPNAINEIIAEYNGLDAAYVQEVFSKNVFPNQFFTVIVGNKDEILPAFTQKGIEVQVIDLF